MQAAYCVVGIESVKYERRYVEMAIEVQQHRFCEFMVTTNHRLCCWNEPLLCGACVRAAPGAMENAI
jgi:hypothetical protein